PQQHSHWDRQAQSLREQQTQDTDDDRPLDAFRDELFGLGEDRRNLEDEREDRKAEEKRHRDFANEVSVENPEHLLETRLRLAPSPPLRSSGPCPSRITKTSSPASIFCRGSACMR